MNTPAKDKRERILDAAEELFAGQPFHKVLLSDVATAAAVGKGTLYLYFKSKEDLYLSLLYRGFADLVERMRARLADEAVSPARILDQIVRDLINRLCHNRPSAELLRGAVKICPTGKDWDDKRREMGEIIESVIRRGVSQGLFSDPHPEITSRFIPGMIRAAVAAENQPDPGILGGHLVRFLLSGLARKEPQS